MFTNLNASMMRNLPMGGVQPPSVIARNALNLPFIAQQYYTQQPWPPSGNTSVSMASGTGRLSVIPVYTTTTFDRIGVRSISTTANVARLSVWSMDQLMLWPRALFLDCGTQAFAGALSTITPPGGSFTLTPGWWGLACSFEGGGANPSCVVLQYGTYYPAPWGYTTYSSGTVNAHLYASGVVAGAPPTVVQWGLPTGSQNQSSGVWVRAL